jgi:hypothetical protein
MADIQGVITLGTGPTTGADIEHFVLFGLNATGPVDIVLTPLRGYVRIEPYMDARSALEPYVQGRSVLEV